MISAVLIIAANGDVLISRAFREEVKSLVSDVFTSKIINATPKELKNPILTIGSTSFLHIKKGDLYYVAVTRHNADASVALQFLKSLLNVMETLITSNSGHIIDAGNIMDNFLVIYELLDNMIVQGFVRESRYEKLVKLLQSSVVQATAMHSEVSPSFIIQTSTIPLKLQLKPEYTPAKSTVDLLLHERVTTVQGHTNVSGEIIASSSIPLPHTIDLLLNPGEASFIAAPSISAKSNGTITEISAKVTNLLEPLLNYSTTIDDETDLPFTLAASYTQLSEDRFEVTITIKPSLKLKKYKARDICVIASVPEDSSIDVLSDVGINEEILLHGGELKWKIPSVSLLGSEHQMQLRVIITNNKHDNISSWISNSKNVTLHYVTEGYNPTGVNVSLFDILSDNAANKNIKASTQYSYKVSV